LRRISIITPIHGTPPNFFANCIDSMIYLFEVDTDLMLDDWTVVIDGDEREIERMVLERAFGRSLRVRFARLGTQVGLSEARNSGVRIAKGDLLVWLDADDVLPCISFMSFASAAMDALTASERFLMAISDNLDCGSNLETLFRRWKSPFAELHMRWPRTSRDPLLFVDFVYQCQLIRSK
jgi:glycosyltransferase involved in cell wall biosynthesis